MTENEFLRVLYDALQDRKERGRVPWSANSEWLPSRDQLHPSKPRFQEGWHWELVGDREAWWLTVVDPRYPGLEYPWRVRPQGDPAFFESAREGAHLNDADTFIEILVTQMEETDLGHQNAKKAYDQGATAIDPPWVETPVEW